MFTECSQQNEHKSDQSEKIFCEIKTKLTNHTALFSAKKPNKNGKLTKLEKVDESNKQISLRSTNQKLWDFLSIFPILR